MYYYLAKQLKDVEELIRQAAKGLFCFRPRADRIVAVARLWHALRK
jgi:hypothetical protein